MARTAGCTSTSGTAPTRTGTGPTRAPEKTGKRRPSKFRPVRGGLGPAHGPKLLSSCSPTRMGNDSTATGGQTLLSPPIRRFLDRLYVHRGDGWRQYRLGDGRNWSRHCRAVLGGGRN